MISRLLLPATKAPTRPLALSIPSNHRFLSSLFGYDNSSTSSSPPASSTSAPSTSGSTTIIYPDGSISSSSSSSSDSASSESSKSNHLSKNDIAKIISAEHGLSTAQSQRVLNTVFDTIVEAVSKNHNVQIANFGKFHSIKIAPRMYQNPQTKGKIWKEETTRPKFKPYANFKRCVMEEGTKKK